MHIRGFQSMMKRVYFHRDSKREAEGTYDWLVDEVKELGEDLKNEDKESLEDEFADVLAWLASIANVLNIDLQKAALTKYNNRCPKCGQARCICSF